MLRPTTFVPDISLCCSKYLGKNKFMNILLKRDTIKVTISELFFVWGVLIIASMVRISGLVTDLCGKKYL
jgi:hypothetical protein